jgi:hypothetical protein
VMAPLVAPRMPVGTMQAQPARIAQPTLEVAPLALVSEAPRTPLLAKDLQTAIRNPLDWQSAPPLPRRKPWFATSVSLGMVGVVVAFALARRTTDSANKPRSEAVASAAASRPPSETPPAASTTVSLVASDEPAPSRGLAVAGVASDGSASSRDTSDAGDGAASGEPALSRASHEAAIASAEPPAPRRPPARPSPAGFAGGAGSKAPRGIGERSRVVGRGDTAGFAGGTGGKAPRGIGERSRVAEGGGDNGGAATGDTRPASTPSAVSDLYKATARALDVLPADRAQDLRETFRRYNVLALMTGSDAARDEAVVALSRILREARLRHARLAAPRMTPLRLRSAASPRR